MDEILHHFGQIIVNNVGDVLNVSAVGAISCSRCRARAGWHEPNALCRTRSPLQGPIQISLLFVPSLVLLFEQTAPDVTRYRVRGFSFSQSC